MGSGMFGGIMFGEYAQGVLGGVVTISIEGAYEPVIALTGAYEPAVSIDGSYEPAISLDGALE